MSTLDVLQGHNLIDPAHVDNTTGRWLCDGKTADQWTMGALSQAQQHALGWEEMMAIANALQALDNYEAELT
jgi:hypothetical protein